MIGYDDRLRTAAQPAKAPRIKCSLGGRVGKAPALRVYVALPKA